MKAGSGPQQQKLRAKVEIDLRERGGMDRVKKAKQQEDYVRYLQAASRDPESNRMGKRPILDARGRTVPVKLGWGFRRDTNVQV